jgi:hypothetical protein
MATTHIVIDITGYYAPPATGGLWFNPLPVPLRIIDTRPGTSAVYAGTCVIQAGTGIYSPLISCQKLFPF